MSTPHCNQNLVFHTLPQAPATLLSSHAMGARSSAFDARRTGQKVASGVESFWPVQQIEMKRCSLDKSRRPKLSSLFLLMVLLVDFASVDMALQGNHIAGFKYHQADQITAYVTREHHPELVHQMAQLESRRERWPALPFSNTGHCDRLGVSSSAPKTVGSGQLAVGSLGHI